MCMRPRIREVSLLARIRNAMGNAAYKLIDNNTAKLCWFVLRPASKQTNHHTDCFARQLEHATSARAEAN